MPKKFWSKRSRPTADERKLLDELNVIIAEAEASGDKEIGHAVYDSGGVKDLEGLKKLSDRIKNIKSKITTVNANTKIVSETNTNTNQLIEKKEETSNSVNNTTKMEESKITNPEPQEETVEFEEVIDIQKESQFSNPVIEREDLSQQYQKQGGDEDNNGGGNDGGGNNNGDTYEPPRNDDDNGGGGGNGSGGAEEPIGNVDDLPSDTKKKAIKKTSEIAAKIYTGVLPLIPKYLAKVPTAKIQKMYWADEIDINMELDTGDGNSMTVGQYYEAYNANIDKSYVITPDMQKDFQDALKDVLEEKQVAATPIQRLTGVIVMHLATMLGSAFAGKIQVKRQTDDFKQYHSDAKEARNPRTNSPPPKTEAKKEEPVVNNTPPPPRKEETGEDSQEENDEISINPEEVKA